MKTLKLTDWQLQFDGKTITATVPGDITIDLFKAGILKDPYFGSNHKENDWVARRDFTYISNVVATKEILSEEDVELSFEGIDVFSEIYLNGKLLGSTDNMFIKYSYKVKEYLVEGDNKLEVRMISTLNKMDTFDTTGYYAIFNEKRLFVRKAQCHFGWDWAPKICAYGIWQDVTLSYGSKARIDDVYVVADDEGNATFFVDLSYCTFIVHDTNGNIVTESYLEEKGDKLNYYLSKTPFGNDYEIKSQAIIGKKNFACFTVENAQKWWPIGYGEQPLYNYKIELERDGQIVSVKEGRVGFRRVELAEKPIADFKLGYQLKINGKKVFVRGSNWVPIECFTGVVEDDKYRKLLNIAKDGNFNMLRIWGGGIYEKDIFYDLCDELGIMVWQDIMLACGDIPEDEKYWVENMLREIEYNVKRLRNHPSLVYWCGGNEKTGSYGRNITRGDFFTNVLAKGTVLNLDQTRPFARQSPCGWTDVGNEGYSGESHHNSFERSLVDGIDVYRKLVAEGVPPFISESAIMGPNTVETNKKIYPEESLWPMNELWDDRLMENPYGLIPLTFAKRQKKYATDLYGEITTLEDFTAKGMLVHAEAMRAECEFARANEGKCSGFMNWMFSDIWPSGSWSIIDYWCEPKQVYYQMRKSYAPTLATFIENSDGKTEVVVINDTYKPYSGEVVYGVKSFDGKVLYKSIIEVNNLVNGVVREVVDFDVDKKGIYLFAEYVVGGEKQTNLYSPKMWSGEKFVSDYTVKTERVDDYKVKVTIKANSFAKSVFITIKDNFKYDYSDNYIDVEAGEEKTVIISSKEKIDEKAIVVTDFAKMTE